MRLSRKFQAPLLRLTLNLLVLLFFLLQAAEIVPAPFIQRLDNFLYDARLLATMPRTRDERVVILDIDEKSLAEQGQWPWRRDKLAQIVDTLFDHYQIRALGFDMVFAERDEKSTAVMLETLALGPLKEDPSFQQQIPHLKQTLDSDQRFAKALQNRPIALGYVLNQSIAGETVTVGQLPAPLFEAALLQTRQVAYSRWEGYTANLPILQSAAAGAGFFNPFIEENAGGVLRGLPLISEYQGQFYETLALAIVRQALGNPPVKLVFSDTSPLPGFMAKRAKGLEAIALPLANDQTIMIPTSRGIMVNVPFRGPGGPAANSYAYYSLTDVLQQRVSPTQLRGKIVLIGTTAAGLKDLRNTPVGAEYPGVEMHANTISGILDGTIVQRPDFAPGYVVFIVLIFGSLLIFLFSRVGPLGSMALAALAILSVVGLDLWWYQQQRIVMPLAAPLLMIITLFMLDMAYGYFIESRSKRDMIGKFGEYVAPELVEEMARDPAAYNMEGEDREMSVMFADVRDFTTIAESLRPQILREFINQYLTTMTVIIRTQHRGTLDKYIGDAIMAFWGAPIADPEHAEQAVEAALAMQQATRQLNQEFSQRGWPTLKIGIGVNTGLMRVGDMGSSIRRAYTVMGDSVNLASRLEGITKTYGVGIAVGEATKQAAPHFVYRELDRVRAKGKLEAVSIYEPIGHEGEVSAELIEEIKLWHQTLKLYRAQEWDRAEIQLLNLQAKSTDTILYAHYLKQIKWWRHNPPPADWDGVTNFETK
ncbi:CHASE2 domain-containing protein [Parvibium lacunae]|uniref:Adenylate/guanylate cyclase domain-containing protein n=1 Tax=Parvibium lacunae TaxID=1888893 RepID=A0A368L1V0_9BURK|nr:adenylate/guanylate cyclase domain-containing protein [Parvibium lacunae]RCS57529.1 adenylate/guanylate cyclase domain-containing protein [Parvibium lacunae]